MLERPVLQRFDLAFLKVQAVANGNNLTKGLARTDLRDL